MTEQLGTGLGGHKIWRNPSNRGEPVAYIGEFYPPTGRFYFTAADLRELGFEPGQYTIRLPEQRPFAGLISKWQTVTVPK
jgi:hypothetical protein